MGTLEVLYILRGVSVVFACNGYCFLAAVNSKWARLLTGRDLCGIGAWSHMRTDALRPKALVVVLPVNIVGSRASPLGSSTSLYHIFFKYHRFNEEIIAVTFVSLKRTWRIHLIDLTRGYLHIKWLDQNLLKGSSHSWTISELGHGIARDVRRQRSWVSKVPVEEPCGIMATIASPATSASSLQPRRPARQQTWPPTQPATSRGHQGPATQGTHHALLCSWHLGSTKVLRTNRKFPSTAAEPRLPSSCRSHIAKR